MRPSQRSARSASSRRRPHLERAAVGADAVDRRGVLVDLYGNAVELDEKERFGALGIVRMERLLGRLDREPVHHLDRGRQDPGRDDRRDRLAGRVDRPERRELRAHGLGLADDSQRDLGRDPERPLGTDEGTEQVGPVGVEGLAAELDDLAVRKHDGEAGDVVDGESVLEAVGAARVLGHVATDRADLLARGVGRIEVAVGRDGLRDVEVRDARLDDDALRGEVDLEDPVHPRERDHDSVRHRQGAAGEAGARAAGDERDALARADPHHPLHLARRRGQDDQLGLCAPSGEPVAVVHPELVGLADHVLGPDDPAQLGLGGG